MKMKSLLLCAALFLLMAPMHASAFDGDRQGFMLNLGGGLGQGKLTASGGGASASVDAIGFGGDIKIGGGPSNQVLIYYTNRTLWYSPKIDVGGGVTVEGDLLNGMSAAGVSYFLEPQAPSLFFSGALGIGVYSEEGIDAMTGFGFTLGVGFEFVPNFIAELTFMNSGVSGDVEIEGFDTSISNFMVTVSWLAY